MFISLSEKRWNMIELPKNNLTMIDLFCGAGIGACGAKLAGYEIVYAIDNKEYAVNTYNKNIGNHAVKKDIRTLNSSDIPDVDVISGGFPCFTSNTLISTSMGLKKINEVQIGDLVLTHKNRYRKVLSIMSKETKSVHELVSENNQIETYVTSEHPFFVRLKKDIKENNNDLFMWEKIKDVTKKHVMGVAYNNINENPYKITEEECILLGKYLAKGKMRRNKRSKDGRNMISFWNMSDDFLKINDRLNKYSVKKYFDNNFYLTHFRIVDLCSKIGDTQYHGSINDKQIPQFILNLPKNLLQIFAESFFEEINVEKIDKNNIKINLPSKLITLQFAQIIPKIYNTQYEITHKIRGVWELMFSKTCNESDKGDVFYNNIFWCKIKRKTLIQKNKEEDFFKVYNLEVEEDNSYVANNYIVHNCQPFSVAGKGEGVKDEKQGDLGYHFYRIIKEKQPKAFVMENVSGITTKKHKDFFNNLLELFDEAGYNLTWELINCWEYGVPQLRKRVFVIGIRKDLDVKFQFPEKVPEELRTTIRDAIGDLPDPDGIYNHKGYGIRNDEKEFVNKIPPGGNWRDLPEEDQKKFLGKAYYSGGGRTGFLRKVKFDKPAFTLTSCMNGKNNAQILDNKDKYCLDDNIVENQEQYYQGDFSPRYKSRNRQKQWNEPSFTIVSTARQLPLYPEPQNYDIRKMDDYKIPPPRRFTVRECLRLQTVPDWFVFDDSISLPHQYERCSGIPSLIAYKILIEIEKCIKERGVMVDNY